MIAVSVGVLVRLVVGLVGFGQESLQGFMQISRHLQHTRCK